MADGILLVPNTDGGENYPVKLVDNGDGTFSIATTIALGAPSIDIGDVQLLAGTALIGKAGIDQVTPNANEVVLKASEAHVGELGGKSIVIADETTRVADINALTAGDCIGATVSDTGTTILRSLAVGRKVGGSGYLTKFRLATNQVACVAAIRIHFFNVAAPATAIPGDNVPMTYMYANNAQYMGFVEMDAFKTSTVTGSSDSARSQNLEARFQFKLAAADANIYYRLETLTTFTPASGQKFYLEVAAEQD